MPGFKVDLCGSMTWDQLVKVVVYLSSPKMPFPTGSALKPKRASDCQGTWTWGEPVPNCVRFKLTGFSEVTNSHLIPLEEF